MKGIKIMGMPDIRKSKFWILAITVLAVFALTILPFILAAQAAGPNFVFGGFLLNPLDGNSYLAKMYQGWRGGWRFTLPYTAQSGNGSYLFLFYIFLGHLARWLNLPLLSVFHTFRILGIAGMLVALYFFFKTTLVEERLYLPAFVLASLGSGMGWLLLPLGAFTADYWVAETYPFLSAFATPHFVIGLALLLWILAQLALPRRLVSKDGLFILLSALALSVISPFGVIIALVISGSSMLLNSWQVISGRVHSLANFWRLIRAEPFFWILIGGMPLSIYDFWIAHVDPLLAGWNLQNITSAPALWDTIVSLSPAILLALIGTLIVYRKFNQGIPPGYRLLVLWSISGLLLLYAPFELQRRFMMGLYVPLVGLAVIGLASLAERTRKRMSFLFLLVFLLSLPTNLLVLLAAQRGAQTHDPQIYLTRGEMLALTWIDKNTAPSDLILASPQMGLFIPAYTGRHVIYGHPFETVNAEVKKTQVIQWFGDDGTSNSFATFGTKSQDFLYRQHIDYIFLGPREQELGGLPSGLSLTEVYGADHVRILKVPLEP